MIISEPRIKVEFYIKMVNLHFYFRQYMVVSYLIIFAPKC